LPGPGRGDRPSEVGHVVAITGSEEAMPAPAAPPADPGGGDRLTCERMRARYRGQRRRASTTAGGPSRRNREDKSGGVEQRDVRVGRSRSRGSVAECRGVDRRSRSAWPRGTRPASRLGQDHPAVPRSFSQATDPIASSMAQMMPNWTFLRIWPAEPRDSRPAQERHAAPRYRCH